MNYGPTRCERSCRGDVPDRRHERSERRTRPNGSLLHARCMLELTGAKRISARLRRIRRHGPPRPGTGRPRAAGPDILSSDALGSTSLAEILVKALGRSRGRRSLDDLGGGAEDRLDAAEPPELTIASQINGPVLAPAKAGLHLVSASRGGRTVRSGQQSRARGSSGRAAAPPAAARPRRARRTCGRGYPSRRCGRRRRSSSSRHGCRRSSRCTIPATTARCGHALASRRAAIKIPAAVANAGSCPWCSRAGSGRETARKASTQSETDEPANGNASEGKPPQSRRCLPGAHGAS